MTLYKFKNNNKVSPEEELKPKSVAKQITKKNGWTCPWHPFQLLAWILLFLFATSYFGVIARYLPFEWIASGYIIPGGIFIIHIIVHICCLSINPADDAVKNCKAEKLKFDRTKRAHVIENCHCYICQVFVHKSSKHCSVCNKCISQFDHHCKWLNNCVGGHNYRLFLGCVVSSFLGACVMLIVILYEFCMFFYDRSELLSYRKSDTWVIFVEVSEKVFIAFISINGLLLLLAIILLGHLIVFHIYLIKNNLTTYEYIVKLRDKSLAMEEAEACDGKIDKEPHHKVPRLKMEVSLDNLSDDPRNSSRGKLDCDAQKLNHEEIYTSKVVDEILDTEDNENTTDMSEKEDSDEYDSPLAEYKKQMKDYDTPLSEFKKQIADSETMDENKENTGSEESLKEIPTDKELLLDRMELFSATHPTMKTSFELLPRNGRGIPLSKSCPSGFLSGSKRKEPGFFERQSVERSSYKKSESKSEMLSRENSKKKTMKKKRKKCKSKSPSPPRDLPVIIINGKGRPLPRLLPTLAEERDISNEC